MMFDLNEVPFSRYGSYLSFSKLPGASSLDIEEGLYLRTVHGDAENKAIFRLEPVDENGNSLAYKTEVSPEVLKLETENGVINICLPESKIIHLSGKNVGLKLYTENTRTTVPRAQDDWIINCSQNLIKFILRSLTGKMQIDASWSGSLDYTEIMLLPENQENGNWESILVEYLKDQPEINYNLDFQEAVKKVENDFSEFYQKMPGENSEFEKSNKLASYINWASVVDPEGELQRPAMLMSKNWMTNVWSWDHCFNAIALSYNYPELAWDQFRLLFDFQSEQGKLPDKVNDGFSTWHSTKPPIHGWALKKMMERTEYIDSDKLAEIYQPLCRWTEWWFVYRDEDQDGIPEYHHGNDSGWDNSTVFLNNPPVESPDLTAFLIIQMEVLSEVAEKLEKNNESKKWDKRAEQLFSRFAKHFSSKEVIKPVTSGKHEVINCNSLLQYMPVILGDRLPETNKKYLIANIKDFITEYGPATEKVDSEYYEPDGYWRGPIWAPSTMLIIDGLSGAGENQLAGNIAEKFVKMCAKNGFAENFNALTGEGLRDRAYTWTASVYLILAEEYV